MNTIEKVCKTCGKSRPLTEFRLDKHGKYGRKAHCKRCLNITDCIHTNATTKYEKDFEARVVKTAYNAKKN